MASSAGETHRAYVCSTSKSTKRKSSGVMCLSELQVGVSEWKRLAGGGAQSSSVMVMPVIQGPAKTTGQVSTQTGLLPSSRWSKGGVFGLF